MSVRRVIGKIAWLLVCAFVFNQQAMATDFLERFAEPPIDPLQTPPVANHNEASLEGDTHSPDCRSAYKDISTPIALTDAVDIALCNNPQIRAAWIGMKMQAASVGEVRAAYFPTLTGSINHINDQTRYPNSAVKGNTLNSGTLHGALNWRIFDFGGREANYEAANWGLTAALNNHDAVLQKTLSDVVQAYFDAQTAQATWQSKLLNEKIARSTLEAATRRESKGAATRSDTLQAMTALARANLDKSRAQGGWQKSLSILAYVLGVPTQSRLSLADDLDANAMPSGKELDTWLEVTRKQHPAILAARARLEVARHQVKVVRSEGLPTLDFSANYYENGRPGQGLSPTRTQERTLGVTLSLPIFDGFSRTYKIRSAELLVEQRIAELENTEHQILMEVVKAHADATSALENLQSSEMLFIAAQESLDVSQRRYDKGAADILETLGTQAALSDAREQRIRSQAEWRSARLRLLASVGVMSRTDIKP